MEELLKLNICAVDKPSQLRFLYNKISVNIRGLEALGVKSEQYGSLLIPIIMAKPPDEIQIQVARNTSQDVWEIDSLLDLIQSKIDAKEMSKKIKAATEQVKRPSSSKTRYRQLELFLVPLQTQSRLFQNAFTALKDISQHLAVR